MIIDCHTHLNNYHNEQVDALQDSIDKLQLELRRNRVDVAIVLTSYKVNPGRPSTRKVVEATAAYNNIFIVAGLSYLNLDQYDLGELSEFIEQKRVRGLKLYPGYEPFYPSDPKLHRVYDLAARYDIPVMIHAGDTFTPRGKLKFAHPLNIDDVAVDYPEVNFVICHLGNPWVRDTMEVVYKNANVYTDFSGLVLGDFTDRFEAYMHKQVQEMLVWGLEPEKCLFGTDWPISSMESYLDFMEDLRIPQKDKNKIFYENAIKLFRLPIEAPMPGMRSLFNGFPRSSPADPAK